ncbi:unannotated protein [freshwater metagenome]|uniref:Unannotated protein n=1 Tax=freshwater metagenome TaxID=449393 RepID=A0A6J7IV74_9ZZZZ|nr:hypothetical protein [Actinomycetota bacterium]
MPAPDARIRAARVIGVDLQTASVMHRLREAGVATILLKGPALADLLYDAGELRTYTDVDLLVRDMDAERAASVLTQLGYRPLVDDGALRGHRPVHAHEWSTPAGASVDLHRTLPGATAAPADVFAVLAGHTRTLSLCGAEVEALDDEAALVQIALHAAHHGPRSPKALSEVERAAARLPDRSWRRAAGIAEALGAAPAFAAGLRCSPAGTALADRLHLNREAPAEVLLKAQGAPPLAAGMDWLLRTPGAGARARLIARTALPMPAALRLWRPLARRGRAGLLLAYLSHPLWLGRHAVPSLLAMRRARRAAR